MWAVAIGVSRAAGWCEAERKAMWFDDPRLTYLKDIHRMTEGKFARFVYRAATGDLKREGVVSGQITPRWNLAYKPDFPRGARLYDVAKQKGWDPKRDVDWSRRIGRDQYAISEEVFLGLHLDLKGLVDEETLIRLSHEELVWTMSQILHGEQGALMLASQLINVHEDMDGKLFLASQAMDEARHIEAFTRYLDGSQIYNIDFGLKFVIDSFLSTDNWRKQAIGMLVMVEGFALGTFAVMKESCADPLLHDVLKLVMRDEGRHVGFGLDTIRSSLSELNEQERDEMEDYAFSLCRTVAFTQNGGGGFKDLHRLYWQHLGPKIRRQISYAELASMMASHPLMQDFNQIVFSENLLPNLNHLGLLTDRVRPRYEDLGLSVDQYFAA